MPEATNQPAYTRVADRLRAAVLAGVLAPGSDLPAEHELTQRFEVGRTTIREALRVLHAQGLVVEGAGPTAPLRVVTPDTLASGAVCDRLGFLLRLGSIAPHDLGELALVMEGAAVEAAVQRPSTRIGVARTALDAMRLVGGGPTELAAADVRFHLAILGLADNMALSLTGGAVRHAMAPQLLDLLRGAPDPYQRTARTLREHEAILDAVEHGAAGRARLLLRVHLEGELGGSSGAVGVGAASQPSGPGCARSAPAARSAPMPYGRSA